MLVQLDVFRVKLVAVKQLLPVNFREWRNKTCCRVPVNHGEPGACQSGDPADDDHKKDQQADTQ